MSDSPWSYPTNNNIEVPTSPHVEQSESPVNDLDAGTHGAGVYTGGVWVDDDGSTYL